MVDGGMVAAVSDSQAGNQPQGFPAVAGALLGGASGGAHYIAIYSEASEPGSAADRVHCIGAARHDCSGVNQQSVRRADGYPICRRRLCFHLSVGGGEDRASLPVLSSRLLQRAVLARDDWRISGPLAAWLLRGSLGNPGRHDSPA